MTVKRNMKKTLADRFWSKVKMRGLNECWEWQAVKRENNGYGLFGVEGTMLYAHRVAWSLMNGKIPDGMYVLHKCDNRSCCNPNHLFLGTHQDNMSDMVNKGRQSRISRPGAMNPNAKLTESQVIEIRSKYKLGGTTLKKLASEYGVSFSNISRVIRGQHWANIGL